MSIKTYERNNKVFYRIGKTTVCYITATADGKCRLNYGSPSDYTVLSVVCKDRAEAGEKAREALQNYLRMTV